MRFNQAQTHLLHHHRKGKQLRTNNDFEQNSKFRFTAIRYNISKGGLYEKEIFFNSDGYDINYDFFSCGMRYAVW